VNGITNNVHSTRTQAFTYDQLNRVATATASAWSLTFGYDSWANLLTATATGTATPLNLAVNANNHITTAPFAYDAAGNETADATGTYAWNAEGELKTAGGVTYTYDGDGRRVQKSNGKIYWYGGGQVVEESDAAGNMQESYVFFDGKRIANRVVSSGATSYYAEDFIGSSRVITTSAGATCYDADFYPYGAESIVTNTCPQNYKWTGMERDAETGNDDFDARYYSSVYGRFLSADWSAVPVAVPYANLTNPQTLNLYAIVRDNPESYADLDGHMAFFGEVWTGAASGEPSTFQERQEPKEEAEEKPEVKEREEAEWNRAGEALNRSNLEADARVSEDMRKNGFDDLRTGVCYAPQEPSMRSSEPPQLAAGKEAHRNEEIRPGEKPEVRTPSGKGRMDRYDAQKAHIREIKPDNSRGEKTGQEQLQRYKAEMEKSTGKPHTTELTKYPPPSQ
jgi:RHS repeat-associated protein